MQSVLVSFLSQSQKAGLHDSSVFVSHIIELVFKRLGKRITTSFFYQFYLNLEGMRIGLHM